MDCEECDWTGMEEEQDLWSDGCEIRVINIRYSAGRLMDDIMTSAVVLISLLFRSINVIIIVAFTTACLHNPHCSG